MTLFSSWLTLVHPRTRVPGQACKPHPCPRGRRWGVPQAQSHTNQGNKAAAEGRSEEGGVQHRASACGLCEALAQGTQEGFLKEVLLRVKSKLPHHCDARPVSGAPGERAVSV